MTEQPKLFIVSESGSYHFTSGEKPHLVEHCTEQCQPGAVFEAMAGSTIGLQNSGSTFHELPANEWVTVPWDAR